MFITKQISYIHSINCGSHWLSEVNFNMATSQFYGSLPSQKISPLCPREDYSNFHKDWTVGGKWGGLCVCLCLHVYGGWGGSSLTFIIMKSSPFHLSHSCYKHRTQSELVPVGGKTKQIYMTHDLKPQPKYVRI